MSRFQRPWAQIRSPRSSSGGRVGYWSVSNILGPMVIVRCEGAMRGKSLEEGDGSPEEVAHKLMAGIVADPLFELACLAARRTSTSRRSIRSSRRRRWTSTTPALGRFQQKCGQAEVNLNLVIRQLQNSKKAQAPLRFGDATKAIRRARTRDEGASARWSAKSST